MPDTTHFVVRIKVDLQVADVPVPGSSRANSANVAAQFAKKRMEEMLLDQIGVVEAKVTMDPIDEKDD